MTREKLVEIIGKWIQTEEGQEEGLADRILAALDAERVGEVVLGEGTVVFDKIDGSIEFEREATCGGKTWVGIDGEIIDGKKGSLIFRPEVER